MAKDTKNVRRIFVPNTDTDDEIVKRNDNERFQHNGKNFILIKGQVQEVPDWFFEQHEDYLKYEVK